MLWMITSDRLPTIARVPGLGAPARPEGAGEPTRYRPRTAIAVALIAVLLLSAAGSFVASAQDATPPVGAGDAALHPAIGTWRWENDRLHPGDPSYAVIQAGGTYVEYYPGHGVGVGAWEATSDRSISLTIVFQDLDPSPAAVTPGILTYRLDVQVEDGDNGLSATGPYYLQAPDGSLIEELAFDGAATRIEVAETGPLPLGTPAATS